MHLRSVVIAFSLALLLPNLVPAEELGKEGYVDSQGVKIHYVTKGAGPLVVLIHGFPDYWYSWRKQIPELARHFQVVAIDQRGYNKSDQPSQVEDYAMNKLVEDVLAVVDHFSQKQAVIVGHDWGGMVAWRLAMHHPDRVRRLVILNLPHPRGLMRELVNNPQQRDNSQYARDFQKPDAAGKLTPERLARWIRDADVRETYVQAFRRSSLEGMLNYYKANYPRPPYKQPKDDFPRVKCPVLMFHGLKDRALLPGALNGTWDWIDNTLTLVTVPTAGHFVQRDASELVTRHMLKWLVD